MTASKQNKRGRAALILLLCLLVLCLAAGGIPAKYKADVW